MGTSNPKSQSFLALASRGAGVGLKFLYTLLLAKLLGATDMGLYTLALSVASMGTLISGFGFENPTVRLIAKYRISQESERINGLLIMVSFFVVASGLVICSFVILGAGFISNSVFHKPELYTPLILIAGSVIAFSLFNIFNGALRGIGLGERAVFLQNVVVPFCGIILFLLLFYLGKRVTGASIAYLLSSLAAASLSFLLVAKYIKISIAGKFPPLKEVMRDSGEFFSLSVINGLQNWIGIYIIGICMASQDVGIFRVVSSIAILISLPIQSVNDVLPPAIVKYHTSSQMSRLQDVLVENSRWILSVSLPVFIIVTLFPRYILSFFGKDFGDGNYALIILSVGYLFNSFMGTVGLVLRMTDNQRYIVKARAIVLMSSIGLYYFFTKEYGLIGAASVFTAAIIIMNIWNAISMRRLLGIRSYTLNVKDLLAATIAAIFVMMLVKVSFGSTLLALLVFSVTYLLMTRKIVFKSVF
ncbi:MAG: oligosaccharide flippase family protein [Nitrospirota bacterium]